MDRGEFREILTFILGLMGAVGIVITAPLMGLAGYLCLIGWLIGDKGCLHLGYDVLSLVWMSCFSSFVCYGCHLYLVRND